MELTQLQFSEIISNYTSSSEGFVTLWDKKNNCTTKYKNN